MKLLFQGSFKADRDRPENEALVREYVAVLAKKIVEYQQHIVTVWVRDYDEMLARGIFEELGEDRKAIKKYLTFFLSDKNENHPDYGIVKRFQAPKYWSEERTLAVSFCDGLVVVGGGKGTADSIEKAILSKKPIFIAYKIKGYPTEIWDRFSEGYYYNEPGDADFITDENITPEEFFDHAFQIIQKMESKTNDKPNSSTARTTGIDVAAMRDLVAIGKLEEAIDTTYDYAKVTDQGLMNQIIVLSGQLKALRRNRSLGLEDKSTEEARIMLAFLGILSDLEQIG